MLSSTGRPASAQAPLQACLHGTRTTNMQHLCYGFGKWLAEHVACGHSVFCFPWSHTIASISECTDSNNTVQIVFATTEVAPWSKVGGLGDVMGALPVALANR